MHFQVIFSGRETLVIVTAVWYSRAHSIAKWNFLTWESTPISPFTISSSLWRLRRMRWVLDVRMLWCSLVSRRKWCDMPHRGGGLRWCTIIHFWLWFDGCHWRETNMIWAAHWRGTKTGKMSGKCIINVLTAVRNNATYLPFNRYGAYCIALWFIVVIFCVTDCGRLWVYNPSTAESYTPIYSPAFWLVLYIGVTGAGSLVVHEVGHSMATGFARTRLDPFSSVLGTLLLKAHAYFLQHPHFQHLI